jgi:hypothetical protein
VRGVLSEGSVKGVSRECQGSVKGVSRECQGSLNEGVQWEFKGVQQALGVAPEEGRGGGGRRGRGAAKEETGVLGKVRTPVAPRPHISPHRRCERFRGSPRRTVCAATPMAWDPLPLDRLPPFTHVLGRLLFYPIHGRAAPPPPRGKCVGRAHANPRVLAATTVFCRHQLCVTRASRPGGRVTKTCHQARGS